MYIYIYYIYILYIYIKKISIYHAWTPRRNMGKNNVLSARGAANQGHCCNGPSMAESAGKEAR
jgi:hypothetical protein